MSTTTYLITGASEGIGAVYADRLAQRGHDLVLVARRHDRLRALADRLEAQAGVSVECVSSDLARSDDLHRVEERLRADSAIGGLVNNAGIDNDGAIRDADPAHLARMIDLNVRAVTLLSAAFALAFSQALQAVLPGITRTALWSEAQMARLPPARIMEAEVMVDAALAGFDMGETVTIPALADIGVYKAFTSAREPLYPDLSGAVPAPRDTATPRAS